MYISVHRWSKCDKVPCLKVQAGIQTKFFFFPDCHRNLLVILWIDVQGNSSYSKFPLHSYVQLIFVKPPQNRHHNSAVPRVDPIVGFNCSQVVKERSSLIAFLFSGLGLKHETLSCSNESRIKKKQSVWYLIQYTSGESLNTVNPFLRDHLQCTQNVVNHESIYQNQQINE